MARLIDEDTPRWVRWTLLGVTLVVLVLIGAFVWLLDPFSSHEAATSPASPSSSTPAASTSVCGLPDGDQAIPTKAPSASWDQVGSLLLPSSPTLGPGKVAGASRTCFAHSPSGAVVAAYNASAGDSSGANPNGVQYAGFRVIDATQDRVTLEVVFRLTQGSKAGTIFAAPSVAVWKAGDWTIKGGGGPTVLPSMDGYVSFGPGGAS